jgi:hypothetical protein
MEILTSEAANKNSFVWIAMATTGLSKGAGDLLLITETSGRNQPFYGHNESLLRGFTIRPE